VLTRHRRSSERGQTLILALAFLAMFGVFAAAILTFASGVQIQRGLTEKTAATNSVLEGSAQFAIADTGIQGCGTVGSGTMHFASGDNLSYTAGAGACSSSSTSTPGQDCGLCVLNQANCPPGRSPALCTGTPINVGKGNWTVPGEVDVNGSVSLPSLCSGTCPAGTGGRIGLYGTTATCGSCTPANTHLSTQVLDPLAGALPIPALGTNQGSRSAPGTICPGTYTNLSPGNGGILYLSAWGQNGCAASTAPSLYVITGQASNTGGGAIVAGGATLYFTPSGSITMSGNSSAQILIDCGGTPTVAACTGTPNTPTTGPYAGVGVFFDPANSNTISLQGNGNFGVAGTFEASHNTLSMGGNGGAQSFQSGRLIISEIQGNGNGGADLGFGGTLVSTTGCNYWKDSLSGTVAGGSALPAHVLFETACNTGTPTSIIGFGPG
jgi:hypothetical protein